MVLKKHQEENNEKEAKEAHVNRFEDRARIEIAKLKDESKTHAKRVQELEVETQKLRREAEEAAARHGLERMGCWLKARH